MLKLRNKKLKSIPKDARKSLDVLDKVLKKYDQAESRCTRQGIRKLFRPKSLEIISTSYTRNRQEDIRKSLDILDSVLAEYDDDEEPESWHPSQRDYLDQRDDGGVYHVNGCSARRRTDLEFSRSGYDRSSCASDGICFARSSSTNSFQSFAIDGGTSQSMPATFDQFRKFSPPPVPKRNPATRLSSQENLLFASDPLPSTRDELIAKRRSYAEGFNYTTARPFQNSPLSRLRGANESLSRIGGGCGVGGGGSPKTDTNAFNSMGETRETISNQRSHSQIRRSSSTDELSSTATSNKTERVDADGSGIQQRHSDKTVSAPANASSVRMPELARSASSSNMEIQKSPTVAQRRARFEMANHESLNRSDFRQKSSLTRRAVNKSVEELSPSSGECRPSATKRFPLPESSGLSGDISFRNSSVASSSVEPSTSLVSGSTEGSSVPSAGVDVVAAGVERIRLLDEKFAEVRRLLRTKQILPLTTPPPPFAPPPPPKPPRKQRDSVQHAPECTSIPNRVEDAHVSTELKPLPPGLCNGCMRPDDRKDKSPPPPCTVEDIPRILPADVSKVPQLGFSYSMEEDMPPGAKDILTSTPKSELSTGKSTFNDSISSLGYGSSQSDLDLNYPCRDGHKVPVENLKSQTLPVGMKLGPDYYSEQNAGTDCDSLENYGIKNASLSFSPKNANVGDDDNGEHFRSSSAPPFKLLDDEKKGKKSIFGMSRKESKVKNKNECNTSTKLKTSLDDGIILRRIETLGNEFSLPDFREHKEAAPIEEKKRRSVWKSILRRK